MVVVKAAAVVVVVEVIASSSNCYGYYTNSGLFACLCVFLLVFKDYR